MLQPVGKGRWKQPEALVAVAEVSGQGEEVEELLVLAAEAFGPFEEPVPATFQQAM